MSQNSTQLTAQAKEYIQQFVIEGHGPNGFGEEDSSFTSVNAKNAFDEGAARTKLIPSIWNNYYKIVLIVEEGYKSVSGKIDNAAVATFISRALALLEKLKKSQINTLKQQAKEIKEQAKQVVAQEMTAEKREYIKAEAERINLYYLATEDKFVFERSGTTMMCDPGSVPRVLYQFNTVGNDLVPVLAEIGRNKRRKLNTWRHVNPNLSARERAELDDCYLPLTKDEWLVPIEGDYPIGFDLLLTSVTGNDEGGIKHLKECIAWKHENPFDFKLPAQTFSGEGSAGKTALVTAIGSMYGINQFRSIRVADIIGDFTGPLEGATICLLDETPHTKIDNEKMKAVVGNQFFTCNQKHEKQIVQENTFWLFMCSNSAGGAAKLEGGGVDRRWSVHHSGKRLEYWLTKFDSSYKWYNIRNERNANKQLDDETIAAMESENARSSDRVRELLTEAFQEENVAKFLHHCLTKHMPKTTPLAYHGKAYEDALEAQTPVLEGVCNEVFYHPDFQFVSADRLYSFYTAEAKRNGQSARAKAMFLAAVRAWLNNNCDWVTFNAEQTRIGDARMRNVFRNNRVKKILATAEELIFDEDKYGNPVIREHGEIEEQPAPDMTRFFRKA